MKFSSEWVRLHGLPKSDKKGAVSEGRSQRFVQDGTTLRTYKGKVVAPTPLIKVKDLDEN